MLASTVGTQNIILFCLVSYSFIVIHRRHIRFGYDPFSQIFLGRISTHVHNGSLYVCTQYDANDAISPVRYLST